MTRKLIGRGFEEAEGAWPFSPHKSFYPDLTAAVVFC